MTERLRSNLADLAEEVVPVDLRDRVIVGSYRASTRRAYVTIAACLLLAAAVVGIGLTRPRAVEPTDPPPGTTLPTGPVEPLVEPVPPFAPGELANATFTVPMFNDTECPWGEVTTVDGIVAYPSHPFFSGIAVVQTSTADVDGDGADDVIATVSCTHRGLPGAFEVLAFAHTGTGYRTIGTVVATDGDIQGVYGLVAAPDGSVLVMVGDRPFAERESADKQQRTYRWDGARFVQADGPTEFQPDLLGAEFSVRASSMVLTDEGGRRYLDVNVRVDKTTGMITGRLRLLFEVTSYLQPVGIGWAGCVQDERPGSGTMVLVQCPLPDMEEVQRLEARYRFLLPEQSAFVPELLLVTVDQLSPAVMERNLADNRVAVDLP